MKSTDFGAVYERTFVRAWLASGDIRVETVKAYLLSIARNLRIERYRQGARRAELPASLRDPWAGPERTAQGRDELQAVLRALQEMPEVDRAAVLMRANGVPYEDVARALSISTAAARVKVQLGRGWLRGVRLFASVMTVFAITRIVQDTTWTVPPTRFVAEAATAAVAWGLYVTVLMQQRRKALGGG